MPVRIPIPQLLVRLRTEANRKPDLPSRMLRGRRELQPRGRPRVALLVGAFAHPRAYRAFRWTATRLRALTPAKQMGWTQHRTPLEPAPRSLSDLLRARGQPE